MGVNNGNSIYNDSEVVVITPEQFGAIGDGLSDDTTSLQKAINFASSKKIKLHLSGKTYLCTSPLNIPNGNIYIIGEGARCSIILFNGCDGILCEASNNGDKFLTLKDLSIRGDETPDTTGIMIKRLSYNEILNNVIVSRFDTALNIENSYVNKIVNSFIAGGSKYGIYIKTSTVLEIEGGTIQSKSGISYYEYFSYNNKINSTDISAYAGNNVDYAAYIEGGFGSSYSFYYEGSISGATPLIAGICFKNCVNCKFENGSVTNNNTVPAIKLEGACKNVVIENIYFNYNNLTAGSTGVYISSTAYECTVKNCRFKNYDTSIDIQNNTRIYLDTIEYEGTSGNNLIKISNTEATRVIINNVRADMFESVMKTTWPQADINIISVAGHRCIGSTTNRTNSPISGERYYNTTTKLVEYWNGSTWISFDGS